MSSLFFLKKTAKIECCYERSAGDAEHTPCGCFFGEGGEESSFCSCLLDESSSAHCRACVVQGLWHSWEFLS